MVGMAVNKMLPVQPAMCGSCIFRTDGKATELRPGRLDEIKGYLAQGVPHVCHHAHVTGCGEERTCRGGRDYQLGLWHRMGMIDAATDEALAAKMQALGLEPPTVAGSQK